MEFKSLGEFKFSERKQAEDLVKSLERTRATATVSTINTKTITEQAPLLFDLTGLFSLHFQFGTQCVPN
jgi:DNA topoisomerase-3